MAVAVVLYSVWEVKSVLPEIAKASGPRLVASSIGVDVRVLLIVEIPLVVLLLLTPLIARSFPEAIHFGTTTFADYTPKQRERIMPLLDKMMGLLSLVVSSFFWYRIHVRLHSASIDPRALQHVGWWLGGFIISSALVVIYYLQRMSEEADAAGSSPRWYPPES
jgi:hypothetical protein